MQCEGDTVASCDHLAGRVLDHRLDTVSATLHIGQGDGRRLCRHRWTGRQEASGSRRRIGAAAGVSDRHSTLPALFRIPFAITGARNPKFAIALLHPGCRRSAWQLSGAGASCRCRIQRSQVDFLRRPVRGRHVGELDGPVRLHDSENFLRLDGAAGKGQAKS